VPALRSADASVIQNFLEANTGRTPVEKIRIIEWRPSLNHYREAYLKLFSQAADFLKRADAEKRTEAAFGRRWVKNFFRNIANIKKILLYSQTDIPVIITGSGPGLENALPVIKKAQDYYLIIAASSSIAALRHAGINADIIVSTDGGPWALKHIYTGVRNRMLADNALAVNLCACLPSQCEDAPHLVINDGSFWQSIAFHALNIPSVLIPQKGTVTATALELAMILSRGSIFLSGMDFSIDGIRTHARPYGFDYIFTGGASRFTPLYSQVYARSSLLRKGGSMNIYAAWFKSQLALWPDNIFYIGKSAVFREGNPLEESRLKNKKNINKGFLKTIDINENASYSAEKAANAILCALKKPEYSQNLKNELGSLLQTEKGEDLESAIKEIAFKRKAG